MNQSGRRNAELTFMAVVILVVGATALLYLDSGTSNGPETFPLTTTIVITSNSLITETVTIGGYYYLTDLYGCPSGLCYSSSVSGAVVLNCAAAAATAEGCTQRFFVNGPTAFVTFFVKVNYPVANIKNGLPGDNCEFSIMYSAVTEGPGPGHCIPLNSTAFYVTEQYLSGPPP